MGGLMENCIISIAVEVEILQLCTKLWLQMSLLMYCQYQILTLLWHVSHAITDYITDDIWHNKSACIFNGVYMGGFVQDCVFSIFNALEVPVLHLVMIWYITTNALKISQYYPKPCIQDIIDDWSLCKQHL